MHRATPILARLVACGWLGRAEALAALYDASRPAKLSCNLRSACLPHFIPDHAKAAHPSRAQAAHAARLALRPLLAARVSHRQLLAAATKAAHPALSAHEIQALTTDSIAQHLRSLRQTRTQQGPTS